MNYIAPLELSNHPKYAQSINASVIWLHGLGADGYDFEPVANHLLRPDGLPHVRFILPHAPEIAVTRNNGYIMPAWYDIYGITPLSKEDAEGIETSRQYIQQLIENEIERGISSERIVLAGFSQGGAIALRTALRQPQRLAAVLALSLEFNRSMQHTRNCVSRRSVANETTSENLLHRYTKGFNVGSLAKRGVSPADCPVI